MTDIKNEKNVIPEMEAINIEVKRTIKHLELKNIDQSKGKGFECVSYQWICNKDIGDFVNDDTDGNDEFGIDSINIEVKENGRILIKILNCTFSGGFTYKKVDEIKKGLKIIFDDDSFEEIKNEKLKKKIRIIRNEKDKDKINKVEIYYCINNYKEADENCIKSRDALLKEVKNVFKAKYSLDLKIEFLFFGTKEIYEKKIRNKNPLSKEKNIIIKYKSDINKFIRTKKEEEFEGGKIDGCIITMEAVELKNFLNKYGDCIFHYNIRGFYGRRQTNKKIEETISSDSRNKFWFLNNGITLVCEDAVGESNNNIRVKYPQIVNGQQTLKTISLFPDDKLNGVDVLVKIYITNNEEFFSDIAMSTNSQIKIDYSDLSSNKTEQHAIKDLFEEFGYYYKNKKGKFKKNHKEGIDSKTLGRISMATINKHPSDGRRITRDSIIFNEDNYDNLFSKNPYFLLLSFLIYNYCKKNDLGIKEVKRLSIEREIKHWGYFHLSSLIWSYLEKEEILSDNDKILDLIETKDFKKYYQRAFLKLKKVIKEQKNKNKEIVLKDYFNNTELNELIFVK